MLCQLLDVGVLDRSRTASHLAAVSIKELKSNQIRNQKMLLKLQDNLIQCKMENFKAFQTKVKSEIRRSNIRRKGS